MERIRDIEHLAEIPKPCEMFDLIGGSGTGGSLSGSKIWEVARATSAAATFFKSIKVGRDEIEFVNASFGHNNPCETVIIEAEKQFPSWEMVILSIGIGLGDVVQIGDTKDSMAATLRDLTMSSKAIALRLEKKYKNTERYYRFSVEKHP
ncbi:hypothetical protein Cpir12675_006238 [Ceratocystis pirilliformis]|uniref:Uncharacterized protein n=1 Tax=Ceratocystis pirilliformis TaxID=259994 RepID=A0ABR3YJ29_9PEZI